MASVSSCKVANASIDLTSTASAFKYVFSYLFNYLLTVDNMFYSHVYMLRV